jgi:hypothetical protein
MTKLTYSLFFSICLLFCSNDMYCQRLNFATTEYYLSPDTTFNPGTNLTASGTTLAGFNYSTVNASHPIFTNGVFLPVKDCSGKNIWVRFQHIAADPNGTNNGYNVPNTSGTMLSSTSSSIKDTMIGGWTGFLYDIRIFIDQNPTGIRANILGNSYPTNITVESLETLYNNGQQSEWLSFIIKNTGSTGWYLNSTNFTGINPNGVPGFSTVPIYTGLFNCCPEGFSNTFPSGSDTIYAISLSLTPNHSEFRMSASGVSHFTYGYEFTSGGYQGMAMMFGSGPIVSPVVNHETCEDKNDGSIELDITAAEPINVNWSNGSEELLIENLSPGTYSVTILDGVGCSTTIQATVEQAPSINLSISILNVTEEQANLKAETNGINAPYTYLWNTGDTTETITISEDGVYSVTVTDTNNCEHWFYINYPEVANAWTPAKEYLKIYPVPANESIKIETNIKSNAIFYVRDITNKLIFTERMKDGSAVIDISTLPGGIYYLQIMGDKQYKVKRFVKS